MNPGNLPKKPPEPQLTQEEEPDDFLRYIRNMALEVVMSVGVSKNGITYAYLGKEPKQNGKYLLPILKNWVSEIERMIAQ